MSDPSSDRAVHYAVGLRKRLQKDAFKIAGLKIRIPRYALVGHVGALLSDIDNLPVQHGLKPRTVCMSCLKIKPATLHWTADSLCKAPGDESSPASFVVMCRACAACRDKIVAAERMKHSAERVVVQ